MNSTLSYIEKTPISITNQNPVFPSQLDECPSPIRIKRKPLSKPISTSRVIWNSRRGEMPISEICFSASEINNSSIHFVIWNINEQNNSSTVFIDEYISISKLLEINPTETIDKSSNIVFENRKMPIVDEKLYKKG